MGSPPQILGHRPLVSSIFCGTDARLGGFLPLQPHAIQRPRTALTGPGAGRPCRPLRLPTRSPVLSRSSRLTQAARGGEPGGGAGARSAPEAAPGSTRPGRSRHVTGAARSPSRAGPSDRPAMGDEDEDEGCAVELQITEGGCRIPRRLPGTGGKSQRPAGLIRPPVPAANLTGHEEKVSVENFALLKVLGTGGENCVHWASALAWYFGPSARPLAWTWAWAWLLGRSPHPFPAEHPLPAPPYRTRVPCPLAGRPR